MKPLSIPGEVALEKKVAARVEEALQKRLKSEPHYPLDWKKSFHQGMRQMKYLERLKLKILHLEFNGKYLPVLPILVGWGRRIVKRVPFLKNCLA